MRSAAVTEMLVAVVFDIGGQRYALPVGEVREVVRLPALLSLAGAPAAVCGLLNLRGTFIPVLDGRRLVGAPLEHSLSSQVIVAGAAGAGRADIPELGLLVDQVVAVQEYRPDQRVVLDRRGVDAFLHSVLRGEGAPALLMDLAELCRLAPAVERLEPVA